MGKVGALAGWQYMLVLVWLFIVLASLCEACFEEGGAKLAHRGVGLGCHFVLPLTHLDPTWIVLEEWEEQRARLHIEIVIWATEYALLMRSLKLGVELASRLSFPCTFSPLTLVFFSVFPLPLEFLPQKNDMLVSGTSII